MPYHNRLSIHNNVIVGGLTKDYSSITLWRRYESGPGAWKGPPPCPAWKNYGESGPEETLNKYMNKWSKAFTLPYLEYWKGGAEGCGKGPIWVLIYKQFHWEGGEQFYVIAHAEGQKALLDKMNKLVSAVPKNQERWYKEFSTK